MFAVLNPFDIAVLIFFKSNEFFENAITYLNVVTKSYIIYSEWEDYWTSQVLEIFESNNKGDTLNIQSYFKVF